LQDPCRISPRAALDEWAFVEAVEKGQAMHGRSDDIRMLNFQEVRQELDELDLPAELYQLWKTFLESKDA
jgi:hypothetical protein